MQHPDWLQPAEDSALGAFGKDRETLDLTNPGALASVTKTMNAL